MEESYNDLNKQPKESQYKGKTIYCDGCGRWKYSIEMRRESYNPKKYCSECFPLFTSK